MRRTVLSSLALTVEPFLAASAQESLSNPCVDPPVNRIRRDDVIDINGTRSTIKVTAEDMRSLGFTSVAEMINQLPGQSAPTPYDTPVSLGDAAAFPDRFAAAFAAAANHLQSLDYDPAGFNARLVVCPGGTCTLVVFPAELGDASASTVRECPVGYCATMVYSLSEERIVEIRD
jgi:hypothetical protein